MAKVTQLKKFMVYIDDGDSCYKFAVPAVDEKDARNFVAGNGEIIAVKEVGEDYTINQVDIISTLERAGFDQHTVDFINRALYRVGIIEM